MMEEKGKVNILFVIVQMKMGGSEHLVWDLIRSLDRNKFVPHVAWFYEEHPLPEFDQLGVPLFYVPKVKRFDFGTMRRIGRIIKKHDIRVVNAHHYLSLVYSFYGAKIANRVKLIYTEHSEWEIQAISSRWKMAGKRLLARTDAVVGISESVSGRLEKTFSLPAAKVHTVENGVDCDVFFPATDKKADKIKYGLDPDDIVLGIVANLKNNKNHIFLLQAFSDLVQKNRKLKLLVIGRGFDGDPESSEDEITRFVDGANLNKSVLFLGGRMDVPDLLKAMDIFCLTSCAEGLPISLIEAMATGLPVVGTDVAGIRDVIVPGENGFLVELNNEEQLVAALGNLIEDPVLRGRFGGTSRSMSSQKYDFGNCIKQYHDLFMGRE